MAWPPTSSERLDAFRTMFPDLTESEVTRIATESGFEVPTSRRQGLTDILRRLNDKRFNPSRPSPAGPVRRTFTAPSTIFGGPDPTRGMWPGGPGAPPNPFPPVTSANMRAWATQADLAAMKASQPSPRFSPPPTSIGSSGPAYGEQWSAVAPSMSSREARQRPGEFLRRKLARAKMKRAWNKILDQPAQRRIKDFVRIAERKGMLDTGLPRQLQMLMPAEELRAITPGDWLSTAGGSTTSAAEASRSALQLQYPGTNMGRTVEEMWATKLAEAKYRPLYGQIEKRARGGGVGVTEPVWIAHQRGDFGYGVTPEKSAVNKPRRIIEGHHRIASAEDINPRMEVPVKNVELAEHRSTTIPQMTRGKLRSIVPNKKLVNQLMKFATTWGDDALKLMMKLPK